MAINITGKFKPQGSFALMDAADVEMPDGSRLSDLDIGSLNVVTYDLVEMGLPNIVCNGDALQVEMDTTEIMEVFATSIITLNLTIEYGGLVFPDVKATFLPNSSVAMVNLLTSTCFVSVYLSEGKIMIGAELSRELPVVSETDNGKFLRVVDGAWAAEALQDVSEVGL